MEDIHRHSWPSLDWWDYSAIPASIQTANRKEPRAIMFFCGGAFETPWYLRGFERFLMDLHEEPEIAAAICNHIELGLDILDPIQVSAAGMSPEAISAAFADRLSFNGAIDEVRLLPNATPDEVYRETTRVIDVLGRRGGYIVSPSHQVQGDTPPENVVAVFNAVRDYRWKSDGGSERVE